MWICSAVKTCIALRAKDINSLIFVTEDEHVRLKYDRPVQTAAKSDRKSPTLVQQKTVLFTNCVLCNRRATCFRRLYSKYRNRRNIFLISF